VTRHIRTVSSSQNNKKAQGEYFDDGKTNIINRTRNDKLNFRRRIKSRLPFAGIIRRLPYSTRFQDNG